MRDDEQTAFFEIWLATASLYPQSSQPSDEGVRLAFEALRGYEIAQVRQALSAHIRDPEHGMFMPKPGDVVRHISGTGSEQGQAAWAKLERAMRSVGQYETVAFDDPIIHVIVDEMGGWSPLCRTYEDELPFRRAEFVKRYTALQRSGVQQWPSRLVGVHETENAAHGFVAHIPEPVLIGDQRRAQKTLDSGGAGRNLQISNAPRTLASTLSGMLGESGQSSDTEQPGE